MQQIMVNEKHWFNEPLVLPKYLEEYYLDFQAKSNNKLIEMGEPVEPDWATFKADYTSNELYRLFDFKT